EIQQMDAFVWWLSGIKRGYSEDLTEPERRANERRMEILTSAEWRHTKVLFTCKEWLRERGRSVEENIPSGGPTVLRLMGKCCYRFQVFDNNTADSSREKEAGGQEEWSRREQKLRALLEAETDVGSVRRQQKAAKTKINMEPQQEHRLETEEEEQEGSLGKEQENKEECAGRKMNRGEDEEERAKVRFERLSSEEDG
ncbi:Immune-associated nucleotide-binding protein 6, partial [Dissostichus eleginoides]